MTVARVARAVDVVPGALYRYFDSKDALLAEMQRRLIADLHDRLTRDRDAWESHAGRSELDPQVRALLALVAVAHSYCELARGAPEQFRLLSVLLGDPRNLISHEQARVTAPTLMSLLQDVRSLFEDARALGALSEGDDMDRCLAYWSSLQGSMQLAKMERYSPKMFAARRLSLLAARALLIGWGADPDTLDIAEVEVEQVRLPSASASAHTEEPR